MIRRILALFILIALMSSCKMIHDGFYHSGGSLYVFHDSEFIAIDGGHIGCFDYTRGKYRTRGNKLVFYHDSVSRKLGAVGIDSLFRYSRQMGMFLCFVGHHGEDTTTLNKRRFVKRLVKIDTLSQYEKEWVQFLKSDSVYSKTIKW